MYESFLVTFRESLEMALIIGIILAYLKRTNRTSYNNTVYLGIVSGLCVSAFLAYLISVFWGAFEGKNEEIFEGVIMLIAAVLLTSMIFWFFRQQASIRHKLEQSVHSFWERWSSVGLFLIVFLSILREGVETVLFMSAIFLNNQASFAMIMSAFLGVFSALFLGYLMFVLGKKVQLKYFFLGSNVLLILFAAGLIAHGLHELGEAGLVPLLVEHLYDINYIINEKGTMGSILKGLFGYNGNPSLLEVMAYMAYIAGVIVIYGRMKPERGDRRVSNFSQK